MTIRFKFNKKYHFYNKDRGYLYPPSSIYNPGNALRLLQIFYEYSGHVVIFESLTLLSWHPYGHAICATSKVPRIPNLRLRRPSTGADSLRPWISGCDGLRSTFDVRCRSLFGYSYLCSWHRAAVNRPRKLKNDSDKFVPRRSRTIDRAKRARLALKVRDPQFLLTEGPPVKVINLRPVLRNRFSKVLIPNRQVPPKEPYHLSSTCAISPTIDILHPLIWLWFSSYPRTSPFLTRQSLLPLG